MGDYRGRFLWYELLTTDPRKAQDFYTKLLGWGLENWSGPGMEYVMWKRSDVAIHLKFLLDCRALPQSGTGSQ